MQEDSRPVRALGLERDGREPNTPTVESFTILNGRRELMIQHGTEMYRLRLTASNKLILTK
ncbi:MAG: hemin uptake protein HemP [Rhodospirillales bacterium]|nr:hemin uptake protein HemP [Rhodospirillales bacterium]